MLNMITAQNLRVEGSHNIKEIYRTVRSKIKNYGGQLSLKDFDEATADLKEYIDELFVKIDASEQKDKMDFSRYPFNTKYENHFYVDQLGNVEIDLENFVTRFENIALQLDHIADYLYYNEMTDEAEDND